MNSGFSEIGSHNTFRTRKIFLGLGRCYFRAKKLHLPHQSFFSLPHVNISHIFEIELWEKKFLRHFILNFQSCQLPSVLSQESKSVKNKKSQIFFNVCIEDSLLATPLNFWPFLREKICIDIYRYVTAYWSENSLDKRSNFRKKKLKIKFFIVFLNFFFKYFSWKCDLLFEEFSLQYVFTQNQIDWHFFRNEKKKWIISLDGVIYDV